MSHLLRLSRTRTTDGLRRSTLRTTGRDDKPAQHRRQKSLTAKRIEAKDKQKLPAAAVLARTAAAVLARTAAAAAAPDTAKQPDRTTMQ
jgi:hypothetical protein